MNKRRLHHYWRQFRGLSSWYLLGLTLLFALITLFALRQNNLTAIHLRDEVLKVDQQNGDTEAALRKLREYVYGHMNTDLGSNSNVYPPIQLKYRYERLLAAQQDASKATNAQIYTDAQKHCEALLPTGVSLNRVTCIQQYLDAHPLAAQAPIQDSLYKFDFASPRWSPDLAGWSLVLTIVFGLLFLFRLMLGLWVRHQLKD
jgi:hypothetical protein